MKQIFLLLTCLFFNSFVYADFYEFNYQGSRSDVEFELSKDVYRTEYRNETQRDTCYRQVIDYYRNYCYYRTDSYCYRDPYGRMICRPIQRRICESRPVYRSEPYTCYRTVRVPYNIFDYRVNASYKFSFSKFPTDVNYDENFRVNLVGPHSNVFSEGNGEHIILSELKSSSSRNDDILNVTNLYKIKLFNKNRALSPLSKGIEELKVEKGAVSFYIGKVYEVDFDVSLFMEQAKLGRNPVLINRVLKNNEFKYIAEGDRTRVEINLHTLLSDFNPQKKYNLEVGVLSNLDTSKVLNISDLPEQLGINDTLKYRP